VRGTYYDTHADLPAIVLLHGTGGTVERNYGRVLPMLANRYRVIGIDFAEDAGLGPVDLGHFSDQVKAVVADAGLEGFTLVGYSLGAVVAADVAADPAVSVDNLVLLGGWMRSDAQQRLRVALWDGLYRTNSPESGRSAVLGAFSPRYLSLRTPAEIDALVAAANSGNDWQARQMDLVGRIDISSRAPQIAARTLIVVGEFDTFAGARHAHDLLGAIDDSRLAALPTGHAIPTERPAQVSGLIDSFVSGRKLVGSGHAHTNEAI
jgi:pimeloyl-ACP methyl ester carboxylesterase